ncbi:hypothetical protein [Rhodanobacter lindaniclasticus]
MLERKMCCREQQSGGGTERGRAMARLPDHASSSWGTGCTNLTSGTAARRLKLRCARVGFSVDALELHNYHLIAIGYDERFILLAIIENLKDST